MYICCWLWMSEDGQDMAAIPESWCEAGVWKNGMASSPPLRERCLSLAITVCHFAQSHSFSLCIFLPWTQRPCLYRTPKRRCMSSFSPHTKLKRPCSLPPPQDLCSSSVDRCCEASPLFIHISISLPVSVPHHLSLVFPVHVRKLHKDASVCE